MKGSPKITRTGPRSHGKLLDIPLCRDILRLSGPLILSMTGYMLMQVVDGLFLARYSAEALAAVGPAGMAVYGLGSTFTGAAGYTSTLTAQYFGAGLPRRIGPAIWQGIWLALASGMLMACLAVPGGWLFAWAGHAPQVQRYEAQYFGILCAGMPLALLGTALSGFFTGRGETKTVMYIQVSGLLLNAVLDYVFIFGRAGMPALGVAGAAWATVLSQGVIAALFTALFLRGRYRSRYATWDGRGLDRKMMARLARFGLPSGFRLAIELLAWTAFLMFVGRIGTTELAATTIAWRINGIAFFPVVGLSEGIRTLVGQAQGRQRPAESVHITWQGLLVSEIWTFLPVLAFLVFPKELYGWFLGNAAGTEPIAARGVVLLRFVAAYCLLDTANMVVQGSLLAAGDTRWTFWVSLGLHAAFFAGLLVADRAGWGLYPEWALATVFVMTTALVWLARFRTGVWRQIRVIEHATQGAAAG